MIVISVATCVGINPPEGYKKTCFPDILFSRKVTQILKPLKDLEEDYEGHSILILHVADVENKTHEII